jgi:4-amino-4-deoxy-L-arabinose transferase-like glycosyltransferase
LQLFSHAKRIWLALIVMFCGFYLYGLGRLPVVGSDEPRYAQVAREMYLRGDWVTPTLGGHTWFEKPALLYWMLIASYKAFGVSEFSVRIGPALCGIITFMLVAVLASKAGAGSEKRGSDVSSGLVSGLVAASSAALIGFSRAATFDIVVTMTLTATLTAFFFSEDEVSDSRRRLYLLGVYVGTGLSLLAKGLIGVVIPVGVIGLYFLFRRKWPARGQLTSLLWGVPIALLVAAAWYGPVISRHGWTFIDQFFIQHHFARFVSDKYHHTQPFYFYLVIVWLLVIPWTVYLFSSIFNLARQKWKKAGAVSNLEVFAIAWMLFPIAFFSFSGSKLPGYILPVLPAAALLVGSRLTIDIESGRGERRALFTGLLALLVSIAGGVYMVRNGIATAFCAFVVMLPPAIAGLSSVIYRRQRLLNASLLILSVALTAFLVLYCIAPDVADRESTRRLFEEAARRGYSAAPVVEMHVIERTAEFYAGSRLMRAADGEVLKLQGTDAVIQIARQTAGPVLVMVPSEFSGQLTTNSALDVAPIGDNGAFALFAVRSEKR